MKINNLLQKLIFSVCIAGGISGFLIGCGEGEKQEETKTLILGTLDAYHGLDKFVDEFNKSHDDIQIEIKIYNEEIIPLDGGVTALQIEIAGGKGPDIINFGKFYRTDMVAGGITEDLYSYMKADDSFKEENYFMNIFDSMAVGGKLYAVSPSFAIKSLAGKTDLLMGKSTWTLQELMEFYDTYPSETILFPGDSRGEVFGRLLNDEDFINWETGECFFQSEEFNNLLLFANRFPALRSYPEDISYRTMFEENAILLSCVYVDNVYETGLQRGLFSNQDITFIGYPNEDGSGNLVASSRGHTLGINVNSNYKEEAWEFIRSMLGEEYQSTLTKGLPVLRSELNKRLDEAMIVEYEKDSDGKEIEKIKGTMIIDGNPPVTIPAITEKDREELLKLIETAHTMRSAHWSLRDIITEELGYYFEGEKAAEEIMEVIQGRASIYVSEKIN